MSIMEIPDRIYRSLFDQEVARLIRKGWWLDDARRRAGEIMHDSFIAHSVAIQTEYEKDEHEYTEDMSLGGKPYRTR